METLYHQTNQLIQETSELFQKLERDPSNFKEIENAIQSKINAISANCEKLDIYVYKTPVNQRPMAKMRVDQLKYDNRHIQASLANSQTKRQRREQELYDRDQLLSRRFGHDHTAINVDYLGQEQVSLQNSHRNVDEMIHTAKQLIDASREQKAGLFLAQRISIAIQRGNAASLLGTLPVGEDVEFFDACTSILETLKYNRETLKGAHRRIIDLANTLGLSNATISLIEKRVSQDKYVLFGGMFVTLAVIVLVVMYLT